MHFSFFCRQISSVIDVSLSFLRSSQIFAAKIVFGFPPKSRFCTKKIFIAVNVIGFPLNQL